ALIRGGSGDLHITGVDHEGFVAIFQRHDLVAQRAGDARGVVAPVERIAESIPGALGVRDPNAPGDLCLVRGQLADDAALLVEAVDAKPLDLLLDRAVAVLEAAFRLGREAGNLRREIPAVSVANAGEADRREDGGLG